MGQATARALGDCGLTLNDIDGIFAATTQARFAPLMLAEYLGLRPRYFDGTQVGGSSPMSHVAHAMAAIEMGLCEVALIAYGSTQRLISRAAASPPDFNPYETPLRPMLPTSAYAMAAARHMHQFGTTREQLAEVAVAARKWALMNAKAWEKAPLTIEQVLSARMISYPFTVRDICLVTDGGGAMILTSADRARALKRPPVYVLGVGEALPHGSISNMEDFTVTGAKDSGRAAYAMARLSPAEINMVSLYDAFTITPILFLEDLGFCSKGGGRSICHGRRYRSRRSVPGQYERRRLIILPSGHVRPARDALEAVRQVRGDCGTRSVADCEVTLAHGNGVALSSQCTVIFGAASTV